MSWPTAASSRGTAPVAVVGRDTRISGQFLEAAVVAGLASAGVDVLLLGVLPTPGVAYMTERLGADLGVMLSASHNPMPDNGIKFLARGGHKLDDAIEVAIERRMGEPWERPTGGDVGRVTVYESAVEQYAAHLESTITHPLVGLKVVLDCAEGAAYAAGPRALRDAGADGHRDPRRARRPQHQRQLRLDAHRVAAGGGGRARRRRRLRARRGRRPLPGRRPRGQLRRRRPDPRDPLPLAARAGPAGQGHRRRDRDEQPRLRAGDAGRLASAYARPRSATATSSRR